VYEPVEIDRRVVTGDTPPTNRQMDVLIFAHLFFVKNDQFPPGTRTSQHFGWKSPRSAQSHFSGLARRGYLEKNVCDNWKFTEKALVALT